MHFVVFLNYSDFTHNYLNFFSFFFLSVDYAHYEVEIKTTRQKKKENKKRINLQLVDGFSMGR